MQNDHELTEYQTLSQTLSQLDIQSDAYIPSAIIQELRDCIRYFDQTYYIDSQTAIDDFTYDQLYKKLQALETLHPELHDANSPTQRVGGSITKDFPQVPHLVPMLSLDNSYNEADLRDFEKKVRNLAKIDQVTYCVEPKFDGSSISLVYENDGLVRGVTRGDGLIGEDITPNIRTIRNIPLSVPFSKHGIQTIEIRGEVLISKAQFAKNNQDRDAKGLPALANPRNSASGSLRLQDSTEVAERRLEAMMYHVSYAIDKEGNDLLGSQLNSRHQNIKFLCSLGFSVPDKEHIIAQNIESILDHIHLWEQKRESYKYELDGMVIKVDDIQLEEQLGSTSHHPRWALAYKFSARQAKTRLLSVQYQVGRVGTITPVAKLEPVAVGGVTVSSITMFNEDFIKEKDIRLGDFLWIERAGDVIPYISHVAIDERDSSAMPIIFPEICPVCNTALIRIENEAAWRCMNFNCPAQITERLIHFASRDAMEISGLGDAIVRKFVDKGWLKNIPDIYRLPYTEIAGLEGFGKKSVDRLGESIELSKSRSLSKLVFGLGIRFVGETTAKVLANAIARLEDFQTWTIEQLLQLPDVGPKVAQSILDYFSNPENITMLQMLREFGLSLDNEKTHSTEYQTGHLGNSVFLFTGTMSLGRNEAKAMVEKSGGSVAGSLSSKVNYLVVGEDPGSKVDKAQKIGTIKIIDEPEFIRLIS